MAALLEGFKALGVGRLIAMAAVAGAMLLILAFLTLRGGGGDHMALLYADMDLREAAQVADQLTKAHIAFEVGPDGTRISVPSAEVPRARLMLAKEGLPSGGSIGYEIFDRGDSLTASQFQQGINQTRALEGELVRSIRMISGVRGARVHLVMPKREPFSRDRQDAQASVVLTMAGAGRLDREGIQAVLSLVSSAVPGLRPQNIGVIDSRGNLLARAGDPQAGAAAGAAAEVRLATEQRLSRAVEDMLERSLGPGRVRVETAVEMNYDQVRETQEKFDPDGKVERSTQNNTSTNKTTETAPGNVSVANNLPNADAGSNPAGSQEQRSEETTNFEIGKTTRTVVRDQPQVSRVSLAVMVDQVPVKGADGTTTWQDRTPDELKRIAALARSAVGFDEKRGDRVEVVSLRFAETDVQAEQAKPTVLGLPIDRSDLMRLGQTGLLAVVALLALLFVLRPMVLRLTTNGTALVEAGPGAATAELTLAGPDGQPVSVPGRTSLALTGPAGSSGSGDESMVTLGNVEGALRASSLRNVAELVEKHPEESLAVMRGWMVKEAT